MARVRMDPEDAQSLKQSIDSEVDERWQAEFDQLRKEKPKANEDQIKRADMPYKPELDEEGGPTGDMLFTFKSAGLWKRDDGSSGTIKIPKFDASGARLPNSFQVWSGSLIKVAYRMNTWYTAIGVGMSLRLQGIQVIEAAEQGGTAEQMGFQAEAGGFEYEAEELPVDNAETTSTEDPTAGEDDEL